VKKDPHSAGSEADIQTQYTMLLDIRKDIEKVADMVNGIEVIRSQLYDITAIMQGDRSAPSVKDASDVLDKKLIDLEDHLIQLRLTGRAQDGVRWPTKLLSRLAYLANGLASGDYPPTNQQKEVHAQFKQQIATHQATFTDLLNKEVAAFNNLLRERKIQNIITRAPNPSSN
jgi:hypothetical protein